MTATAPKIDIAVLDDYQGVALSSADWSGVERQATVTVFRDHLTDTEALVERLRPFDAICVMRERTPLSNEILNRLPRLKLMLRLHPLTVPSILHQPRNKASLSSAQGLYQLPLQSLPGR